MNKSQNTPYVKKYNESGQVSNPIIGVYKSDFPTRTERREHLNTRRFMGNNKGVNLTVMKSGKYKRVRQIAVNKVGVTNVTEHYILQ